jgi:eukaryotic-like serine/threonine-protein kinase
VHDPNPNSPDRIETPEEALVGSPFRVLRPLARGGMGTVVEAEHIELEKVVVIKLLLPAFAERPDLVHRLRVEAQLMTRLNHPNLCAVSHLGKTARGRPYVVMERYYGRTLQEELALRGVLPVHEAVDYVRQALAGLSVVHRAGIVHRDVKLDNLFLCDPDEQGRRVIKVLDFGVAKVLAREAAAGQTASATFRTTEGTVLGTPAFMSPEQATARTIDARTDVYATAVVLFRLVAGRGPFVYTRTGADPGHDREMLALMTAHAKEMPRPPSAYAPQPIPRALDEVILRALSKHPDDRPQSAAAFAAELEQATRVGSCAGSVSRPARTARGTMLVHRGGRAARVGKGQTVRMAPGLETTALIWNGSAEAGQERRPAPAAPAQAAQPAIPGPALMGPELDLGDRETIPLAAPDHGRLYTLLVVASAVIVFVALSLGLGLGK